MQDLRKKLLQAGLVDKKQARQAKADVRRQKKKKGGTQQSQQETNAEQKERYETKLAEQKAQAQKAQEQIQRQKAETARLARIRDVIRTHATERFLGEDRLFYVLGPDGRIRKLSLTFVVFGRLRDGSAGVVQVDDDPRRDYAVVDADAVRRLEELAPQRILFWNRPGLAPRELPAYGSGQAAHPPPTVPDTTKPQASGQ